MSYKGVSVSRYRKSTIALAMFITMLVVFAFTMGAQTTRLHADVTKNVATWAELKKAISESESESGLTTIKITEDLVASSQIVIKSGNNVKIASDSNKTIYREKGHTDFSVFKVNGELELTSNVHMSGHTAEAEVPEAPKYHIYFKDGVGNVIYDYEFASNATGSLQDVMFGRIPRTASDLPNVNWGINSLDSVKDTWFKYLRDLPNTSPAKHGYEFDGWEYPNDGDFWANNFQLKNATGNVTLVAKWKKAVTDDVTQPLKSWAEVNKATTKDGFVLMGYVNKKNANNPVLYVYGQQKLSNDAAVDADRGLFYKFSDITSNNNVTNTKGFFKWFNSPIQNSNLRMLAVRSDNPNADAWGTLPDRQPDPLAQPFRFTGNQPINWNKKPEIKRKSFFPLNVGYVYTSIGESGEADGFIRMWLTNEVTDDYGKVSGKRYLLRMDDNNDTGWIGVHANVTDPGNYTGVSGQSSKFWKLGFFSLDQARAIGEPDWAYTKTDTAGMAVAVNNTGGKIKKDTISTGIKYTKAKNDATNNNNLEHFAGGSITKDEANGGKQSNTWKGFFAEVASGGKLKISGANLENFNTVTGDNAPKCVAPVYVEGDFEMASGEIRNNAVSYTANETISKNQNVRNIQNHLKNTAMTNSAGGVIISGKNATGTITGGEIKNNKGDAGGMIVTNKAKVTIKDNAKINSNLGFHHAGAVLVDNGATVLMQGGEIANNVTWAKGGAVWATQWGTNGYVQSDWSKWPKEFPKVTNPGTAGEDGRFIMNGGELHGNTAFVRAGAIEVESNGVELYNGKIYDNNCRSLGGAIYVEGDSVDYSYTLYVNKGYVGNNVAVTKGDDSTSMNGTNVNDTLDRYLKDGQLSGEGTSRGSTYDPDFNGALGNGGGVWLCPVGGTSVFANGQDKVNIDDNTATRTGTDFYLSKGTGSTMVQNMPGEWYKQNANNSGYASPKEKLNFDEENGTVLNGVLPMINGAGGPNDKKTAAQATNNFASSTGVMIYDNKSRDGGGIAANGTLMMGSPKNIYRYDARIDLEKKWDIKDNVDGKTAKFRVHLTDDDGNIIKRDIIEPLVLDGKMDQATAGDNNPNVQIADGEIASTVDEEDGKPVWRGGSILPSVVTVTQNGSERRVPTYVFYDPTDTQNQRTLDLTRESDLAKLKDAIFGMPNHEVTLTVARTNFVIEEEGTLYKLEMGPITVKAKGSVDKVVLSDPITGNPKQGGEFYVTFSNATFAARATNKDKPSEIPVSKTWLRSDGMLEISKKNSNNSGQAYYNWPAAGPTEITFNLKGNGDKTFKLKKAEVEAIIAGSTNGLTGNVELVNDTSGLAKRQLVYKDSDNKELYRIELVREDYAMYFIGDELIYSEPYDSAKTNSAAYDGSDEEAKIKNYIAAKAQAELDAVGRTETASASNVNLSDAGKRVLFPKIIMKDERTNASGSVITYTVTESDMAGYAESVERVGTENEFTATNTSTRTDIPAVKKWINHYGVAEATKTPNGLATGTSLGTNEYVNWPAAGASSIKFRLTNGSKKYTQTVTAEMIQKLINGEATGLADNATMNNASGSIEDRSIVYTNSAYKATVTLEKKTYRAIFIGDEMIYGEEEGECRENTKAYYGVSNDTTPSKHWTDYIAAKAKEVMDAQHRAYTYSDQNTQDADIGWAKAKEYTLYFPKVTYAVNDGNFTFDEPEVMNGTTNVKGSVYRVTTAGDKTTVFTATNAEDRKDVYVTKVWKDKNGDLILTQNPGNGTDFSSLLTGNTYLNWPSSNANWIRLKIENTANGSTVGNTHVDIDVKDLEDIMVNNSLRSGKDSSTVKFHADADIEKRYIEFLGSGDLAGKTIAKLAVKKETVNGKTVYSPIVTFIVDNDESYRVVEAGIGNSNGQFGKYTVTYDQDADPKVVTNSVGPKEIPANKTWLDQNGVVMATKKPNGVTWAESQLADENGYLRFINWPESGADKYTVTLNGGTPASRQYDISLTDIKPLVTGNASDMADASSTKTFHSGANIVDRYVEWKDDRGTARLSLEMEEYYIIYDINGNPVYSELKSSVDPKCGNGTGYNYPADYMVAKGKEALIARGKTQAEADALIKRGTAGGGTTKPADGFINYGERVYLYTPKITYKVDTKDDNGNNITYTLSESDMADYIETVSGDDTQGFKISNKYNKIEIPVSKVWTDYDDNLIMSNYYEISPSNKPEYKDKNGNTVWVNWPSSYADYVSFIIKSGSDQKAHWLYAAADNGKPTIKSALAGGLKDENITLGGKTVKTTIAFDTADYYVVQEKATGNKIVMTLPKSDVDANKGESTAEQYALRMASIKSGKAESELELTSDSPRKVYFPKLVFTVDKYDGTTLKAYNVTEEKVNNNTNDYAPHYYDAEGDPIASTANATEDGITVYNDRKLNVRVTKKWMDGTETTWPDGVDKITFKLVRITWTTNANHSMIRKDEDGKPIEWKNADGSTKMENGKKCYEAYEYYPNENDSKRELTKAQFNGGTKYVEWTALDKYDMSSFGNANAEHDELIKNRFYVLEETPDGYISDIPVEYTVEQTGKERYREDRFKFDATNTKLTDVQATKKWGTLNSSDWPSGKTVNFHLKRWLKYDSFGKKIHVKKLSTDLYIMVDGNRKYLSKNANNEYYVEIGGKTYNVQHKGYVEMDGMLYAILPEDTDNITDNNNVELKVLVTPKDKDGNDVTQVKTATSSNRTVTWKDMPKYDYDIKVSDAMAADDNNHRAIRIIRYWIEEEWVSGYDESITYNGDTVTSINVLNKATEKIEVPVRKYWNDGGITSSRPTIKFQLWGRSAKYDSNGRYYWTDNGKPMAGAEEFVMTPDSQENEYRWRDLTLYDSSTGEYHYYAPREMVKVGQDANGKDVFVYVNTFEMQYTVDQKPGKIVATPVSGGYEIKVFELNDSGQVTNKQIGSTVTVKTLDENALGYNAHAIYFKSKENANGCGLAFGLYAYNSKPAIEKYVNKDVHQNLATKDEVFTYDVMAFVPAGSKEIKIYDPLVKALEFVDKSGKKQSETDFSVKNLVDVSYMDTNNHKAISKDPANASVTKSGTALATNKYDVAITRNPTNGSPLGSSSAADYATKLNNYINLTDYENKLTVTIPESTLTNNVPETGLWVKVTFKAKIRDDINFENLSAAQREKLGFETITTNDPVETEISTHTGFKNKASYDVKLINNYKFENVPSNEVTVVPPTSLKLEKKVTGTLGDLQKEFVFKVELTGVKHTDGDAVNKRDYYYAKDKSNVVNGTGQPKAYMHEDMDDQDHQTYRNGFNVSGTTKDLWFKIKAGQSIEIQGLPVGATYKITEVASDHVPSYKITDLGNVKETSDVITAQDVTNRQLVKDGDNWIVATTAMVGTTRVVATNVRASSNSGSGQSLSTAVETVDPGEMVVVTYTNHRDIETETGIIKDTWPWNIILLILLILLAYDDQMRKIKNRLRVVRNSAV